MDISLTNVYLDHGAGTRGAAAGPFALHEAGLVALLESQGHRIPGQHEILQDEDACAGPNSCVRYLEAVSSVCARLADAVELSLRAGRFPLICGGDHSQSIGSISGLARHFRRAGKELGVLWVDAHADMNTPETTTSGNLHGMPLAVLLGHGREELRRIAGSAPALDARHVVLFGVRDIDAGEAVLVKESGVRVFTKGEVTERGADICVAEALMLLSRASAGIHLSFDLDACDPVLAPGVTTAAPDGLTYDEAHAVCLALAYTGRLTSMEVAELAPKRDVGNRTAELAIRLIETALSGRLQARRRPHAAASSSKHLVIDKRRAGIVAQSLYREMSAQGFALGEIMSVATALLGELISHVKEADTERRSQQCEEPQQPRARG